MIVKVTPRQYEKLKEREAAQVETIHQWDCPNETCGYTNYEYEEPYGELLVVECYNCHLKFIVE